MRKVICLIGIPIEKGRNIRQTGVGRVRVRVLVRSWCGWGGLTSRGVGTSGPWSMVARVVG
jgi:hypothetical protein